MSAKTHPKSKPPSERWYRGADIPKSVIRRFARQVAERFHTEVVTKGKVLYEAPNTGGNL